MATATVNVNTVKWGYVKQSEPRTVFPTSPNTPYAITGAASQYDERRLYFELDDFPASLWYNKFLGGQVHGYFDAGSYTARFFTCKEEFDPQTLTFANAPSGTEALRIFTGNTLPRVWEELLNPSRVQDIEVSSYQYSLSKLMRGSKTFYFSSDNTNWGDDDYGTWLAKTHFADSTPVYITVYYDDAVVATSQVLVQSGPSNGSYSDPRDATVFTWQLNKAETFTIVAEQFTQASAVFHWKAAGSESYTDIPISGDTKTLTVPANTFPTATTISWYITATDTRGTTSSTGVYSFSTADGTAYAEPTAPMNEAKDGGNPILFTWSLSSESSYSPTRVLLEWKSSGTWTTLMDMSSAVTSYLVPADTFPAGTVEWRVSAYNRDGTQGPTAEASFVCLAAPATPVGMTVTAVPFAEVQWQSSEQQAFEIFVDGTGLGPVFGTAKTYTFDEPLSDGSHTISVSVQGEFGLWSKLAEQTIIIQNQPGQSVTLSGSFDVDAALIWTTADATWNFYIYRDGVRIGHTGETAFADRLTLGTHDWQVLNRLPNGNYTRSNTVTGTTATDVTRIAAFDEPGWISLALTDQLPAEELFGYEKTYSLRHVTGSALPVLELSPYISVTFSGTAAFKDTNSARPFEALRGRVVILKLRTGRLLVGALTSVSKRVSRFFITCSFTIAEIAIEEYVDDYEDG